LVVTARGAGVGERACSAGRPHAAGASVPVLVSRGSKRRQRQALSRLQTRRALVCVVKL
jgi:hypothetical protein